MGFRAKQRVVVAVVFVCLCVCLCVRRSVCLPDCVCVCLCLSERLLSASLPLSISVAASLSVYPFVFVCISVSLVSLSVGRSVGRSRPIALAFVYFCDDANRSPAPWTSSIGKPFKPVRAQKTLATDGCPWLLVTLSDKRQGGCTRPPHFVPAPPRWCVASPYYVCVGGHYALLL